MLDRIICNVTIDPYDGRTLKITPINIPEPPNPREGITQPAFKDNSVYDFKIPKLKAINSSALEDIHVKYITSPTPCYISLRDVTSLANGLSLDDESVMYHIREACKYADYIASDYNSKVMDGNYMTLDKDNIQIRHYEIYMFIKYKALRDCLLDFYIKEAAKPDTIKNQTGDLIYEHKFNLKAIKDLLDDIEEEHEEWVEKVITITASPMTALRGRTAIHKVYPTKLEHSGYGRDRFPKGIDTGSSYGGGYNYSYPYVSGRRR